MKGLKRGTFLMAGVAGASSILTLKMEGGGSLYRDRREYENRSDENGLPSCTDGTFRLHKLIINCHFL